MKQSARKFANDSESSTLSRRKTLALTFGIECGLFTLAWSLGWGTGVHFWLEINVDPTAILYSAGLTLLLFYGVTLLRKIEWRFFQQQFQRDAKFCVSVFKNCSKTDLFIIASMAGLAEEALFRGFLQPYVISHTGIVVSLVITNLIFGVIHPISWVHFLLATVIGLYLGLIYFWLDNLFIPIFIHALYDFLIILYFRHKCV